MRGVYVGIDVGGTHTDGVAVEGTKILHKVKVRTRESLQECTLDALRQLLEGVPTPDIRRVVLSTTLVTNAVVESLLEPAAMLVTAGPGMQPSSMLPNGASRVVRGAMDHRGREIAPLDEAQVCAELDGLHRQGIRVLAVVGKFSIRNPAHELRIAELAGDRFDYLALGHGLSGALNFPRRAATAFLAASVWRRHKGFIESMASALEGFGIRAPLYLLRADGGTQRALSFRNPAEGSLSGPAASVMGIQALDAVAQDTIALDIGGTTTDISLYTAGAPLLEPRGATIGPYRTQIRSLYTRSLGAGGDSLIQAVDGVIRVGPRRLGPPASLGGEHPTPTDALVLLGRALGNRARAAEALRPIAASAGIGEEECARRVLQALARRIADAAAAFIEEVNAKPVYTIHELLEGHRVRPVRAVAVGGPARAIAAYVEEALDLPVHVPNHFDVANAVGAALSRVNLEVNAVADTALGRLSIPEAGVHRKISRDCSLDEVRAEAEETLMGLARDAGVLDPEALPEVVEQESFRIVEGFSAVGSVHRLRVQIRPGILGRIE
ncbi:MAG: hydantoinase/oxoprolinase family protein [Deferrisomatales bacterium]|nr:hydantoinase/oxoprolinase family protein [Deferrisomatales bacterium]